MRLHETFQNIHKGVLRATRLLMEQDLWSGDPNDTVEHFQNWCDTVCGMYDMSQVRLLLISSGAADGLEGGMYVADEQHIVLTRPSVLWMLHQFRHHMQAHGKGLYNDPEIDSIGWACSVLHHAAPQQFCMLVSEGVVPGVTPYDLIEVEVGLPEPEGIEELALDEDELDAFEEITEMFMEDIDDDLASLMEQLSEGDSG